MAKNNDTPKSIKANVFIDGTYGSATLRELKSDANKLFNELNNVTRGTAEWNEKLKQVQQANKYVRDLQKEVKGVGGAMDMVKSKIMEGLSFSAGFFGFQALTSQFTNIIVKNADLADSISDIQKVTSLSKEEVIELNGELGDLTTRKSRKELRDLAIEAGKLGKDGVAEIKEFVDEAQKIDIALGGSEGLGEGAITKIGKISDIYHEGMIEIASGINAVGAASKATESWQVDFLSRMSGVAPTVKLAASEVLGYGSALENLGQTQEVSGTAMNQFFIDFTRDAETFGQTVGMARGEMTKLLNEKGTNAGFLEFLKRLKEGSSGSQEMLLKLKDLGVDGTRGANVLLTLANNLGLVKSQQELASKSIAEGTSVLNEFYIKNNNDAAILERVKKYLAGIFINEEMMSGMGAFVRSFAQMMGIISDSEAAMVKFAEQSNKVAKLDSSLVPLLDRYEELKGKTTLTKDEQNELKETIEKVSKIVPTAVTAFDEYGKAIDISTGKARGFIEEQKKILQVQNAEAIDQYKEDLRKLNDERQKFVESLQTGKISKATVGSRGFATNLVQATNEELIEVQRKLKAIEDKMIGTRGVIKQLSGEALDAAKNQKGSTSTGNDFVETETEEQKKAREKYEKQLQDDAKKLKNELQKIKEEAYLKSLGTDEKEIAAAKIKYEKLRTLAHGNKKSLVAIKDAELAEITAIEEKNALDKRVKQAKVDDELFQMSLNKNQKEVAELDKQYEDIANKADAAGLDTTNIYALWSQAKLDLLKKQHLEEVKETDETNKKLYKLQLTQVEQNHQLLQSVISGIGSLYEILDQKGSESVAFQKALAFTQILIDTATAISKAVATGAAVGLTPIEKGIAIAGNIAVVLTNIAKAKALMSQANIPRGGGNNGSANASTKDYYEGNAKSVKIRGFAEGGYSGFVNSPTIFSNSASGVPFMAGERGTEYIISNDMLRNPFVANVVPMLEGIRRSRAFYEGGPTNEAITFSPNINTTADLKPLLEEIAGLRKDVRGLKLEFNLRTFEDEQARLNYIRSAAGAD